MLTRTYRRKLATRRVRYTRSGECQCHRCKASNARRTWRPADYEPDFDGPIRADSTEG